MQRWPDPYGPFAQTPRMGTPTVRLRAPESSSEMKDFKLPHAIVIASILVVFGLLAWQQVDVAAVVGGVLAILGGLGWIIKQGAEQGEQNRAIQTAVNGNNNSLVETIKSQHAEAQAAAAREREAFMALVQHHQEMTAKMVAETNQHFRELAEKLAVMVPVAAVAPAVVTLAPTSGPPADFPDATATALKVAGYP